MKRFVAFVTSLAIMCSSFVSASAASTSSQNAKITTKTVSILGEKVSIQYKTSGNNIVYAKATNGNDIGERIGNIIYLNGTKVATINEEAVTIEPRTG